MPLIKPPNDYGIPQPEYMEEAKPSLTQEQIEARNRRFEIFWNVPGWYCPQCNANNFGRNLKCAICFGKLHILVPRPESWSEK